MPIRTHKIKVWPEFYQATLYNLKLFEIRQNDRDYQVDDILILREYDPKTRRLTGEQIIRTITYVTDYAQQPGYVVMGIRK